MRIIQVTDGDTTHDKSSEDVISILSDMSISVSHEQYSPYEDLFLVDSESRLSLAKPDDETIWPAQSFEELGDENSIEEFVTNDVSLSEQMHVNEQMYIDENTELIDNNELSIEENEYVTRNEKIEETEKSRATMVYEDEDNDTENEDHHDSDTESFYNIWGDDNEWLYGNKLRNVVRVIHR